MLNKVFSAMAVGNLPFEPKPAFIHSIALTPSPLKIISNVFRKYTEYLY